ncbi:signal transduction histidine kinase [Lysobacter ruishenii]|uniref:Signal transduction histidine kinase n=2 Tax=Aerolutibacter ruishenii TaxID=686800 RepID=A0A562M0V4_9GAMM|nr:signal transduction histidine kinase [Lysobacter ruishenii]
MPEVTFFSTAIAARSRASQHAPMSPLLRHFLQPLNLAGLFTLVAVGMTLRWLPAERQAPAMALLVLFGVVLVWRELAEHARPRLAQCLLWLMPPLALALLALAPRLGTPQILLVVWVGLAAYLLPARMVLLATLVANTFAYLLIRQGGHEAPFVMVMLYVAFQAFAALTSHYACTAERARDSLARVNADLLATRVLLADSARDSERLRVARELHDVAGHKLTALTLNLRAIAAEPAFAGRRELAVAQQMAGELMGDLRNVVQQLRDSRGLDLATALRALAAPLPRPALQLAIDDDVRITDAHVADTVLRVVQEALTNSVRHGDAKTLHVHLQRDGGRIRVSAEDDGRVQAPLREGNGLAGMRERVEAVGGALALSTSARGALRIDASVPA